MSHTHTLSSHGAHDDHHHDHHAVTLDRSEIQPAPERFAVASKGLLVAGVASTLVAVLIGALGMGGVWGRHAMASYLVGVMAVMAISLGATFFVMVFHLVNAGWTATLRRQFENVMSFLPIAWVMLVPVIVVDIAKDGLLYRWLSDEFVNNPILKHKASYFFAPSHLAPGALPIFFLARMAFYGVFWFFLTNKLRKLSLEQDITGDRWLTAKARRMCAWALPVFALTIAFAAFDYLMSLDFTFFSTMWGVYYFAGSAFSAAAVVTFLFARLRATGKLRSAVTIEHFHDMGKLMFAFTVFWAYIAFSQYFLYWYSNIPEETAFFLRRYRGGWMNLGIFLMIGHFVAPFLLLVSRVPKRIPGVIAVLAAWAVFVHVADIFWIVRPMVYAQDPGAVVGPLSYVVDALAILGVLGIFAGFVWRQVGRHPLVAHNDPWLRESLVHRNYV